MLRNKQLTELIVLDKPAPLPSTVSALKAPLRIVSWAFKKTSAK